MIIRATVVDTPRDPFTQADALRVEADAALVVRDGVIVDRGGYPEVAAGWSDEPVQDLREGVVIPGLVDTHVHYPQLRAIAGLGLPLLDWLDRIALPEEARLADAGHAATIAEEFVSALACAGTTTALVFGAHFPAAVDALFRTAERSGLRITSGLVVSDRLLRPDLHTTPERATTESLGLIERWHGRGRLRYAVTPRFALSCTDRMLEACGEVLRTRDDLWFTSHLNENAAEIAQVRELFPRATSYLDAYEASGLLTRRSVFAHNVHPTDAELERLAAARSWVAHCPTSNCALGSGMFPMRRHLEHGVGVALGSDVGGGTGLFLFPQALQALFVQQLRGPGGSALQPAHLLYLCTGAGATALGLRDRIGDLSVGKEFDAVWIRPLPDSLLGRVLPHSRDAVDLAAKLITTATQDDIAAVWVAGEQVRTRGR